MIMSAGGVWDIQLTANGTRSRLTLNITLLLLQIKEHLGDLCTSSLWLSAEVLVGSTTRKMELSRYEILWSLWPRPTVIKSRTEVFEKFVILWYWHLIPSKMLSYGLGLVSIDKIESPVFFLGKLSWKRVISLAESTLASVIKKYFPLPEQELTKAPVRMLWCLLLTVLPRIGG